MPLTETLKNHWARQDLWRLTEAASLLAGQDPNSTPPSAERIDKQVRKKNLKIRLEATINAHAPLMEFIKARDEASEAIHRAILAGTLVCEGEQWVRPADVIRWASERNTWHNFPFNPSDLDEQTPQTQAQPAPKKKRDRDLFAPLLRDALRDAKNPNSNAEVLNILRSWGVSRPPLVDVVDGEVKWLDDQGEPRFIKKKALADRLRRLRESGTVAGHWSGKAR